MAVNDFGARELQKASDELEDALAGVDAAQAKLDRARAAFHASTNRSPRNKRKPGRPSIWKGPDGFRLVMAVREIREARSGYGVAQALRIAAKRDPKWKRLSDRALQARYQEALNFWAFLCDERRRTKQEALRAAYKSEEAGVTAAWKRVDAASTRLNSALAASKKLMRHLN